MNYVITRPFPDGKHNYTELVDLGFKAIYEPVIDIVFFDWPAVAPSYLQDSDAYIFTSQNGIRAFSVAPYHRNFFHKKVFAIGKQTARLARDIGFKNVFVGGGDIEKFIPVFLQEKPSGLLSHIGAKEERIYPEGSLTEQLRTLGFKAQKYTQYQANPVDKFQHGLWHKKEEMRIILYSPRSAEIFSHICHTQHFTAEIKDFFCLSVAVAKKISQFFDKKCYICDKAEHNAMLKLLQNNKNEC